MNHCNDAIKKIVPKDFQLKNAHKKRDCYKEHNHNIGINKLNVKIEKLNDAHFGGISNDQKNGIEVCNENNSFDTNNSQNLLIAVKEYFVCEICNHRSKEKSSLEVHMAQHIARKPLVTCQLCHLKFTQKASLNFHMKKKHLDVVKTHFQEQNHLKVHKNTIHYIEKPFNCRLCPASFAQKGNLKTHLRTHSGEKPFRCQICERQFTQLCHLQVHLRRHTGEKPFFCTFCNCKFTQKSNLVVHMKNHEISV